MLSAIAVQIDRDSLKDDLVGIERVDRGGLYMQQFLEVWISANRSKRYSATYKEDWLLEREFLDAAFDHRAFEGNDTGHLRSGTPISHLLPAVEPPWPSHPRLLASVASAESRQANSPQWLHRTTIHHHLD